MVKKGYFIITDISGYTAFLAQSELEHAQEIITTLFDTQLEQIKPPLIVSNFQGDAILSYVPEGSFIEEQTLIERLEQIYFAFSRKIETMHFNTTCTCKACENMLNLDLKIFVHYGDYLIQKLRDKEELMGSDVILLHRMTKNQVVEKTGIKAYALFSKAAKEALKLEKWCSDLADHFETYEHVGDVDLSVHCLKKAWEKEKETNRTMVSAEEAWVSIIADVEAPPHIVWDYVNRPELKIRWLEFDKAERIDDLQGRAGVGTKMHCAHGDMNIYETAISWKPFDYVTHYQTGFGEIYNYYLTYSFTATPTGTKLACYIKEPEGPNLEQIKPVFEGAFGQAIANINKVVKADVESGKVVLATIE